MKWLICAVVIICLAGMWLWRERRKRTENEPASIVLLLNKPRPLNVQLLADLLGRATERAGQVRAIDLNENPSEEENNEPVGDMVMGASPHFMAHVGGTMFTIHNVPAPYMNDPVRACETFPELRLRKAIRDHQAWLSIDIAPAEAATPEAYRVAARTLANLIDADCLALFHPPLGRFVPCSMDETIAKLRSDDPITAVFGEMSQVPVIAIDDDDPRLIAAGIEARRRFPEFETAFQSKDGSHFAIKTKLTSDDNSEHIWVEVDRILEAGSRGAWPMTPWTWVIGSWGRKSSLQWTRLRIGSSSGAVKWSVCLRGQFSRNGREGKEG